MKIAIPLFLLLSMFSACMISDDEDKVHSPQYTGNLPAHPYVKVNLGGTEYKIEHSSVWEEQKDLRVSYTNGKWHLIACDTISSSKRFSMDIEFKNQYGTSPCRAITFKQFPENTIFSNLNGADDILGSTLSMNLTQRSYSSYGIFQGTFSGIIGNIDSLTAPPVTYKTPIIITGEFSVKYK